MGVDGMPIHTHHPPLSDHVFRQSKSSSGLTRCFPSSFYSQIPEFLRSQACMDPSGSDNDECASVQLGSSDMAPSTMKVTFLIYMLMSVLISFHTRPSSSRGFQWGVIMWDLMVGYRTCQRWWSESRLLHCIFWCSQLAHRQPVCGPGCTLQDDFRNEVI